MVNHSEALETFKSHLRTHGQRYTPERAEILETVLECSEHFSAESLVSELRKRKRNVSLATVYRTIPVLIECGFVEPSIKMGDVEYFERRAAGNQHHDHILCTECGKIVEFYSAEIEELQDKIAVKHGFRLLHHSHVLKGICQGCR